MTHDCDQWSTTGECICPHHTTPDTLPDDEPDNTVIWNGWISL